MTLQIIPAIDILGGKCARLRRGDYDSAEFFGDNPEKIAQQFCDCGAKRLHIVDLDAAKSGKPENDNAIADIINTAKKYHAKVQVGGGLRNMLAVRKVLELGAAFAIVGTAAVRNPSFLKETVNAFPKQILLAADARNGQVAVAGWQEESGTNMDALLDLAHNSPPAGIVFTDIGRDGMMDGVNAKTTGEMANRAPCPLIASGGVRGEEDMQALAAASDNITGAVIGRAVYENMAILKPLLQQYGGE